MDALVLAAAISAHSAVGPLRLGEPVREVQRALGRGTRVPCWYQSVGCGAVAYSDGVSVLRVSVANNEVDQIQIERYGRGVGRFVRLPASLGAIASWHWDGGPIFRLPTRTVGGWKPCTCDAHGVAVEYCGGPPQGPRALVFGFELEKAHVTKVFLGRS